MLKFSVSVVLLFLVVRGIRAQGVSLEYDGVAVPNFGIGSHIDVDNGNPVNVDRTIVCRTDNTSCCRNGDNPNGLGFGDWYYPSGDVVLFNDGTLPSGQIYRQLRGSQIVFLRRVASATISTANGIYRCEVADQNNDIQTRYIGLYTGSNTAPNGVGVVSVSGNLRLLLTDLASSRFVLIATTTGGPPTTFTWSGPSGDIPNADSTVTVTNSRFSSVQIELMVTGNAPGVYTFTVSNPRTPNGVTAMFTVSAGGRPNSLNAVQEGNNIRVTWSAPDSGVPSNGYIVYYQAGSGQVRTEQTSNTQALLTTNLVNGAEHTIEVAAVADIPGVRAGPERVVLARAPDPPEITLSAVTATGVTVAWNPQEGVDQYEVQYTRVMGSGQLGACPDFADSGSQTTGGGATSLTLQDIEEFSTYDVMVVAVNSIARVPSVEMEFMTLSAVPSPLTVQVGTITNTTITISWTPLNCIGLNSEFTVTNYTVHYGRVSSSDRTTVTLPASSTTFTVSNLEPGTPYSIEVAAVNSNGETGEFSSPSVQSTEGGSSNGGRIAAAVLIPLIIIVLIIVGVIIGIFLWRRYRNKDAGYTSTEAKPSVRYTPAVKNGDGASKPEILTRPEISKAIKPAIVSFPNDTMRVTEGEGVYLEVKAVGAPSPTFKWYYNGKELQRDYSFEILKDGSISIPSSEMRHTGVYRLEVTNVAGTVSKEVNLTVGAEGTPAPGNQQQSSVVLQAIKVSDFGKHVADCHANNDQEFRDMYDALPDGSVDHPSTIATTEDNRPLNRFANIVVYDDNRVLLQPMGDHDDCQSEYINACYVDGFSAPRKFLATQGPLPKTNVDFWRLVWQERVPSIVMITNIKEGAKIKCQQYWPQSGSVSFGPFSIKLTDQQVFPDYVVRKLEVSLHDEASARSLKVTQYHFTAWPDHGVPDYATPILAFHKKVISQHRPSRGPMLVHCSAGVGRTGTFMCIDNVLDQAMKEDVVDIPGVVSKLRQQRMKMVQTAAQFTFIHDAVLESLTCGDTQINPVNLRLEIKKLANIDSETGKTGFEKQFKVLGQVSPKPNEINRATALQHPQKNRTTHYLPADRCRVVLRGEHPDYIHAVNVNGYKQQRAFIIAQGPMRNTARDFWKMIYDRKCGAIVMLSGVKEGGRDTCMHYWPPSGSKTYTDYTVELLDEQYLDDFIVRSFSIAEKSGKAHQVTQFHIQNWTPDGRCSNLKSIIAILDEVAKVQRKTGNRPVVVHCSDTVSRSGMFCAITTTIERCKTEGVVDVFQSVKALRVQKPGAVLSVEQYKVVFDVVLQYLDSFEDYANFH